MFFSLYLNRYIHPQIIPIVATVQIPPPQYLHHPQVSTCCYRSRSKCLVSRSNILFQGHQFFFLELTLLDFIRPISVVGTSSRSNNKCIIYMQYERNFKIYIFCLLWCWGIAFCFRIIKSVAETIHPDFYLAPLWRGKPPPFSGKSPNHRSCNAYPPTVHPSLLVLFACCRNLGVYF